MNEELKPCPFCGGEATISWFEHNGTKLKVYVYCDKCAGNIYERARTHYHDAINIYDSEDEAEAAAIKEWNTRYERTCKMIPDPDFDLVTCSQCGHEEEMHLLFPAGEPQVFDGNYCPNCGARVERDDDVN